MPPKTKKKPERKNSTSTEEDEKGEKVAELLGEEESAGSSKKATGSKSGTPKSYTRSLSRSNKNSLDPAIQAELLEAVEGKLGGGRSLLLSRPRRGVPDLLEAVATEEGKLDVVGALGSKLRKACDNKIRYWLKLPDSEYTSLLESFKVIPNSFRDQSESFESLKKGSSKRKNPPAVVKTHTGSYQDNDTSLLTSEDDDSTRPTAASSRSKMSTGKNTTSYAHYEKVGNTLVGE